MIDRQARFRRKVFFGVDEVFFIGQINLIIPTVIARPLKGYGRGEIIVATVKFFVAAEIRLVAFVKIGNLPIVDRKGLRVLGGNDGYDIVSFPVGIRRNKIRGLKVYTRSRYRDCGNRRSGYQFRKFLHHLSC